MYAAKSNIKSFSYRKSFLFCELRKDHHCSISVADTSRPNGLGTTGVWVNQKSHILDLCIIRRVYFSPAADRNDAGLRYRCIRLYQTARNKTADETRQTDSVSPYNIRNANWRATAWRHNRTKHAVRRALLAIKPDEKFHNDKYGHVNLLLIANKIATIRTVWECQPVLAADTVVRQN